MPGMGGGSLPWSGCAGRTAAAVGLIGGCRRCRCCRLQVAKRWRIQVHRPFRCTDCRLQLELWVFRMPHWDGKPAAGGGKPSLLLELADSGHGQRSRWRRWRLMNRYLAVARAHADGHEQRHRPPPRLPLAGTWFDTAVSNAEVWENDDMKEGKK